MINQCKSTNRDRVGGDAAVFAAYKVTFNYVMPDKRRNELEDESQGGAGLTSAEYAAGWHFCPDWDFMLVGPSMPEFDCCCTCSDMRKWKRERIMSKVQVKWVTITMHSGDTTSDVVYMFKLTNTDQEPTGYEKLVLTIDGQEYRTEIWVMGLPMTTRRTGRSMKAEYAKRWNKARKTLTKGAYQWLCKKHDVPEIKALRLKDWENHVPDCRHVL